MNNCDRCGKPTIITRMSMYNLDICCPPCITAERARPDYKRAVAKERQEVRRGNYNYPGIGLFEILEVDGFGDILAEAEVRGFDDGAWEAQERAACEEARIEYDPGDHADALESAALDFLSSKGYTVISGDEVVVVGRPAVENPDG